MSRKSPETPMHLYGKCDENTFVAYEASLLAFEHDGIDVRNPYLSLCGRGLCDPVETYGFEEATTGGGLMALQKDLPDGRYLRIDYDGCIPDVDEWDKATISLYNPDGNCIADCELRLVPDEDEDNSQPGSAALKGRYRAWAIQNLATDEMEFSDMAKVVLAEGGAYVTASIWVPQDSLPETPVDTDE